MTQLCQIPLLGGGEQECLPMSLLFNFRGKLVQVQPSMLEDVQRLA